MADSTPCAVCKRSDPFKRYRGARFGVAGFVCPSCRVRFVRRLKAVAAVRAVRVPKPRPQKPARHEPTADELAAIAERHQAVREQAEREGRRPRLGATAAELEQRRWRDLATMERRRVVASRRQAVAFA